MDDSRFDDLLRKKLRDYEDPLFDPEALDDLHGRIQGQKFATGYANRAIQVAIAAILLLTGTNAYFILSNQELKKQLMTGDGQSQEHTNFHLAIDSLNHVISQLQCESETTPVVFVKSETRSKKIPDFQMKLITVTDYRTDSASEMSTLKLGIGRIKDIPSDVYQRLKENGWISEENGVVYLNLTEHNNPFIATTIHTDNEDLLTSQPGLGAFRVLNAATKTEEKVSRIPFTRQGEKSLKARNALEKHYYKGIGIQLAPHVDFMQGIFSQGEGQITPRVGLTAGWILSPHVSVETGLDYATTEVRLNSNEINYVPDYTPNGTFESAFITNKLITVPLAFKYRMWAFDKSQLIWRTTFTPYWLITRSTRNSYEVPDPNPDRDVDKIVLADEKNQFRYFGSTIGTSLGLTLKREKNRGTWEASLFYERSVGNTFDQNALQLIGLRTAYWFRIK